MAPVTSDHQDVVGFLLCGIATFVEEHHLGTVRHRPFQMKTRPALPGRAPDIMFVGNRKRRRLHRYFLSGPADLVIEVADRGSRASDRGDKFFEYEQGGVPEYWFIEPERKAAEFYRITANGRYDTIKVSDDGIFRSRALEGFWLRVNWLWKRPRVRHVLTEWGLV